MRSLIDKSRKDIESNAEVSPAMRPVLLTMMSSLESFMKSVADTRAAEAASEGKPKAAMPEFEVARIETLDVTREIPKGSREALVRQVRSKWDISFPQAMMWGVLACAAGFAITLVRERKQGEFRVVGARRVVDRVLLRGHHDADVGDWQNRRERVGGRLECQHADGDVRRRDGSAVVHADFYEDAE